MNVLLESRRRNIMTRIDRREKLPAAKYEGSMIIESPEEDRISKSTVLDYGIKEQQLKAIPEETKIAIDEMLAITSVLVSDYLGNIPQPLRKIFIRAVSRLSKYSRHYSTLSIDDE